MSYWPHKDVISSYSHAARKQGLNDCDFVTNRFLLADKPKYREPWWRRLISGCNGSTHVPKMIISGRISESDLIGAWESYGQVKIKANNIAISIADSLNGKGTRFLKDSFHCINVVKIFDINGRAYALSFDPEANCGIDDVERINMLNPVCNELCELGSDMYEAMQEQCAMYRLDLITELISNADMLNELDTSSDTIYPRTLGLYVAEPKLHL